MNKFLMFVGAGLLSGSLFAASTVTVTAVRQNWPWSPTVDISYTLEGDACDIDFAASFDGQASFPLAEKDLSGDFFGVKPGSRHVTWDPVSAGFGGRTLPNFTVTAQVSATDRTYLILDLKNGTYEYAATAPADGWIAQDSAYYRRKMVFRRIPAGTKTVGFTTEILDLFKGEASMDDTRRKLLKEHEITLTDDFYLGVYAVSQSQQCYINGVSDSGSRSVSKVPYNALRGYTSEEIDWPTKPTDIYAVSSTSGVACCRNLFAGKLPREWAIDLPTVAQFEYAQKATTPVGQIWSTGGTVSSSYDELTNALAQVAVNGIVDDARATSDSKVGQLTPNGWGLYDMCGLVCQWTLNYYVAASAPASATDPLGSASGSNRTRMGMTKNYTDLTQFLPTFKGSNAQSSSHGYRLCIHTRRIRP